MIGKISSFFINKNKKNVYTFIPLMQKNVESFQDALQISSDCYLLSSLDALTRSRKGQDLIGKNIRISTDLYPAYKCTYNNVNGNTENYIVERSDLIKYSRFTFEQKNNFANAMKVSMQKLIKKHPTKKDFLNRLALPDGENFEYNRVSRFMEMFTGKPPIVIGESGFNFNLKPHKDEVMELFEKLAKTKKNDYSFVAGTGPFSLNGEKAWHCFVVEDVNLGDKLIRMKNKRSNLSKEYPLDYAMKKLKYIVGYFNENL